MKEAAFSGKQQRKKINTWATVFTRGSTEQGKPGKLITLEPLEKEPYNMKN